MTLPTSEIMKKYFFTALIFLATTAAFAQKKELKKSSDPAPNKRHCRRRHQYTSATASCQAQTGLE